MFLLFRGTFDDLKSTFCILDRFQSFQHIFQQRSIQRFSSLKIYELVECAKDTITLFSIFVVYNLSLILIYVFPNFYGLTRLRLPQFRLHLVHRFSKDEHFDLDYGLEYMIHPILSQFMWSPRMSHIICSIHFRSSVPWSLKQIGRTQLNHIAKA